MNRAAILLPLLLANVLAGCLSLPRTAAEPTRFFVLTSTVAPPAGGVASEATLAPVRLRLEAVATPEYLETEKIAVRVDDNQIEFRELDRWAEPVSAGLLRVLKENLESFPEILQVDVAPFSRRERPDYSLSVSVRRLEGDRSSAEGGSARFEAFWSLRPEGNGRPMSGLYRSEKPWDGQTNELLAASISRAAFGLCGELVKEMRTAAKKNGTPNAEGHGVEEHRVGADHQEHGP